MAYGGQSFVFGGNVGPRNLTLHVNLKYNDPPAIVGVECVEERVSKITGADADSRAAFEKASKVGKPTLNIPFQGSPAVVDAPPGQTKVYTFTCIPVKLIP